MCVFAGALPIPIVTWLLAFPAADPDMVTLRSRKTPLMIAVETNKIDTVMLLLRSGCMLGINKTDKNISLAKYDMSDMIEFLFIICYFSIISLLSQYHHCRATALCISPPCLEVWR